MRVKGHVIIEVTVPVEEGKPIIILYDAGTPAAVWGNIGNEDGIVDPAILAKIVKDGGLTLGK